MRAGVAASLLTVLAACDGTDRQADAMREVIRPQITRTIAQEYPGVSVTPLTTCVLANMTEPELQQFAQASLQGLSGRDVQTIRAVVRRPETRACAFDAGVSGLF